MLRLPTIFSDGFVLQADEQVKVWGFAQPGEAVTLSVLESRVCVQADKQGNWLAQIGSLPPGGPYDLTVSSDVSQEYLSRHFYAGEVFLCSGQSNMELPMKWVASHYPSEFLQKPDPLLRQYKVFPRYNLQEELNDHEKASWTGLDGETISDFSALGYFFARLIRQNRNVPVGILNVSLGGSPIESWMDIDMVKKFPQSFAQLEEYLEPGVAQEKSYRSLCARDEWYQQLGYPAVADSPREWLPLQGWDYHEQSSDSEVLYNVQWREITLPGAFDEQLGMHFCGELELIKHIYIPFDTDDCEGRLQLGTMSDADHTWVNGVLVGGRTNLYEPRNYTIPSGILHQGENEIRIRLVCEHPGAEVTPGKSMVLSICDETFDVAGTWSCAIVKQMNLPCPSEDFVRWKPVGLYNAMLVPCIPYTLKAVLWYQGESNAGGAGHAYAQLLSHMIKLWREKWADDNLPFFIVQLPGYSIGSIEDGGWSLVREDQWNVSKELANVATVVTLDAGEYNDLHPYNKKTIASRIYAAAQEILYKEETTYIPQAKCAKVENGKVIIEFDWQSYGHQQLDRDDYPALNTLDGQNPLHFELVWEDSGSVVEVPARIVGNTVTIDLYSRKPTYIRYAWSNCPQGALICDERGQLVPPFNMRIQD